MLKALEQEGTGEQQFKSRTWASSTGIMIIKWLLPRTTPSQKYHASVHMQLWLLASFTPAELSFPMQAPCSGPHLGKESSEGLVAAELLRFKVGAKTLLLKTEQGDIETNPLRLEPPQSLFTLLTTKQRQLHCHTK